MRFKKLWRKYFPLVYILSILFMRFEDGILGTVSIPKSFQFSLWDSYAGFGFVIEKQSFFQFSLWDSEYISSTINVFLGAFQFSLWDSIVCLNLGALFVWYSFNSLYEIHGKASPGCAKVTIDFQFSLWDSNKINE